MRPLRGQCTCGDIQFETAAPILRAFCHCSICKAYHNRAFADFTVFRLSGVVDHARGHVSYKVFKNPPFLKRGTCDRCAAPVLEKLFIPGLPRMMLIPSRWIAQQEALPKPGLHMFYDLRETEAQDDLPKAQGYLGSQMLFARHLIPALLRTPS